VIGRLLGSRQRHGDLALALLLACFGVVELWIVGVDVKGVAVPAALVAGVALYWRRVAPLVVVGVVLGTIAMESLLGVSLHKPDAPLLVSVVALYTAAAYLPLREAALALAMAVGALWIAVAGQSTRDHSDFAFTLVVLSAAWLVGRGMHGRVTHAAELAERTERIERNAEADRAAAVAAERRRIARDLHDVIAHSVGVMVVQAGAAEEAFEGDGDGARRSIRAVQETGRAALTEMTRLLGLLREDGAEVGLAPQPRLEELPALVEAAGHAGLHVDLRVEGEPRALPLGVELSVYRIAQEALTNARKHSTGGRARVLLRYATDAVELVVTSDGAAANGHRGGHGLIGMRERVAVFGGTLDAGPLPDVGFRVRARLPLRDEA
jgi:signal transduction histidine kinase